MFTKLWTVKLSDFERAFIIAILSGPLGILYDWAITENFQFSWRSLAKGAVAGGAAYLMKNLLTGKNGKLFRN